MPAKICGYLAQVGVTDKYTSKEGREVFRLRFGVVDNYYTKDRFGVGTILNPTVPKIMAAVEAARKGESRPTPAKRTAKRASTTTS
jgi:hypothetical protein